MTQRLRDFNRSLRGDAEPTFEMLRDLELTRVHGLVHAVVLPLATYAPWASDAGFRALWDAVRPATLIDQYRGHSLYSIAAQCAALPGDLLEVGVWRGGSAALIASVAKVGNPKAKVFLADTFAGVVKAGAKDTAYRGGEHGDTDVEQCRALFDRLELSNTVILAGVFPEETGAAIADRRFSFCHIDVDVHDSVRDTFAWVWPRLLPGGCVVFDDYGFDTCPGATLAVNAVSHGPDRRFIHNLNGQAILIKLAL